MRVLLTGANGMLGSAFAARLGPDTVIVHRAGLDIRDPTSLFRRVEEASADWVVNCAAHVDAEAAEREPDLAYVANERLPALLAAGCRNAGARLLHVSSTGCYGDWKETPYDENDPARPTTVHHRSKVAGERAIEVSGCQHLILRVGWLFGGGAQHKKNFVWRRIVEAARRERMESDADQSGNPTYVEDVVDQALLLMQAGITGLYNCVSHGRATRFDYVRRIVETSGLACVVSPRPAFERAAPVSRNETAVNYRLGLMGLDRMTDWTVSLDAYVAQVKQWPEWRAVVPSGAQF
jgi:dTDP-4-dehydrorhamnose reductase